MKKFSPKPYRLCKDIDNPQYDKRCNHGHCRFAVFKAGPFFEGYSASLDAEQNFPSAYVRSKEWSHLYGDIAALIIGNSEETKPANWHELATLDGGWHHLAPDVLETLVKTGAVSLDQLSEALRANILSKSPINNSSISVASRYAVLLYVFLLNLNSIVAGEDLRNGACGYRESAK